MAETDAPSIARASAIVALGNIASRVLGLLRDIVLSNVFGASRALESFNNAVLVSRSIFDLLIAGHVSSAIVPVLSEVESTQGRDALWRVLAALAGAVIAILSVVVLVIIVSSGVIAGIIDDDWQTVELTGRLIQLTAPALLLMSLFALYSGTLYALRIFTYPALAAAVFNLTMVAVTLLFAHGQDGIYAVAAAWIAAAAAQLALQLYGLRRGKLGISFNFRDALVAPVLKRIGWLYVPVIGSLVVDLITTRFLTYALAARAAIEYGNTYMTWATTLIQFPQGLVATAISAAVLPSLSRAALQENQKEYDDTLGLGLRLTTALILPAAAALAVLAVPVIQLVYEHGAFTPYDTGITANALRLYLIGLPFAAWDLLLIYGFYAKQDTVTPASIGVFSFGVYTVAALALFPAFGLYALMMADAVKHITHATLCAVLLIRRRGHLGDQRLMGTLIKSLIASAGMAGAAAIALNLFSGMFGWETLGEVLTVVLSLVVCGVSYAAIAYALKLEEFRMALALFTRRLR